jgi:hypothetical protein
MKFTLTAFSLIASALTSSAALYTLNNGSGASAAGVQTSEGYVFRSSTLAGATLGITGQNIQTSAGPGVIAFGFFSTDALSGLSASSLVSLFTQFGNVNTFGGASTGGNRSVFSTAQNQTIGSTYNNKPLYFFAGNGSTFLNSTQFLVAKMDSQVFAVADDTTNAVTPKVIAINPGNSTAILGTEITNVYTTNTDATTTAGWQMVPEPSTALLGAIGALGLLRRRRN